MPRHHDRLNWKYDDDRQELRAPSGVVVTVKEIAQRLHDDATCRYDFGGPWLGWKMRGDRLIPPHCGQHHAAITPRTGPKLLRWIEAAKSVFSGWNDG